MRRWAGVALAAVGFVLALAAAATAAWTTTGIGSGQGAVTAGQVTPVVSLSCSWASSSKVLTVRIAWTKAGYAQSNVVRVAAADGSTLTVATGLASTTTSTTDSATLGSAPAPGKSNSTGAFAYNVTAFAGTYWSRTGTSGNHTFTYTTGTGGKNPTPDSCVVN